MPFAAHDGLEAIIKHDSEKFLEFIYDSLFPEIYITSFCTENREDKNVNENGLLSQWRAYGENGGYAIVFDKHGLDEMLKTEFDSFLYDFLFLEDVIYSDDEEKYKLELSKSFPDISSFRKEVLNLIMQGKQEFSDNELAKKSIPCIISMHESLQALGF